MEVLSLEESGLSESQVSPLCSLLRASMPKLSVLNLGGHHWPRDCLIECLRILLGPDPAASSSSVLTSLVLPIYGLKHLMFRFKDRFNPNYSKVSASVCLRIPM